MWTIFKVFVEFVIILFLFYVLVFFGYEVSAEGPHPLTPSPPQPNRDGPVIPALEGKALTSGSPRLFLKLLYPWKSLQEWLACHRINGIS